MVWQQVYDPFGNMLISTLLAAIPVVVMLVALGFMHIKAHIAAGLGLLAAVLVAVVAYGMPLGMAGTAAMYGGFTGLLPIGWIVLNIIFLQQLAEQNGSFRILQASLSGITDDRRLQLLLIAFCSASCCKKMMLSTIQPIGSKPVKLPYIAAVPAMPKGMP